MKIEHVALWVDDLERLKDFYCDYFKGSASNQYVNKAKGFTSYFIAFNKGARLELMKQDDITQSSAQSYLGWAHLAFSLGSKEAVVTKSEQLVNDGYKKISGPRITGDGYYESVFEDPEGNLIEISV